MQCPNCKMNVKDDSKFCIYCGSQFVATPPSPGGKPSVVCPNCNTILTPGTNFCTNCGRQINVGQGVQQPVQQPVQTVQESEEQAQAGKIALENYRKAYFGSKYDSVINSGFSFGTLFLGWIWLFIYKLRGSAGKLFLTQFVVGLIARFFGITGGLIGSAITLYINYTYALEFSKTYFDKSNYDIDEIMQSTLDENERLRLCKEKGGVSVPAIIGILALFTFIGYYTITTSMEEAYENLNNSHQITFSSSARVYINAVKSAVSSNEIKCGKDISSAEPGIYYYSFTTKSGDSATKLVDPVIKSPWDKADVAGQVIIHKFTKGKDTAYEYGIVLVDSEGRGIGEFDINGNVKKFPHELSIRKSAVNIENGDYRQEYFNKVSSGTTEALNSAGPTLDTIFEYYALREERINETDLVTKAPIPCEIIAD